MDTIEILESEREKAEKSRQLACAPFDNQIAEIDAAISAIKAKRNAAGSTQSESTTPPATRQIMSIDDGIVEAVRNDNRTPANIYIFLERQLGIKTTINSVRTRVSRLKSDGKIARGDDGWIMPNLESLKVGLAPEDEGLGLIFPPDTGENE